MNRPLLRAIFFARPTGFTGNDIHPDCHDYRGRKSLISSNIFKNIEPQKRPCAVVPTGKTVTPKFVLIYAMPPLIIDWLA